jgi:2-polyprenyl-3-methyl-5-hydroxy-6-metoxy-1,4-benzoquinol methylase
MKSSAFCPLCSSTDIQQIPKTSYTQCRQCTIQFPRVAPLTGVVTNQFPKSPNGKGTRLARAQVKLIKRVGSKKNFLDLGCGNGEFLYALSRTSTSSAAIQGIELDQQSIEAAQNAGLSISTVIPTVVTNTTITMWHVAEHIEPQKLIEMLSQLSEGDNELMISVPNGESISWLKYHEKFSFFDPTSHVTQFTTKSLQILLDNANWHIVSFHRTPWYGIFNAIQTALNLSRPRNELYELLKRKKAKPSPKVLVATFCSLIANLIPLMRMLIAEVSISSSSSLTVLAIPKKAN